MLREVLAAPELLTQPEIALASIALRSAEELAVLEAEVQRLRAAASRAAQTRQTATSQRLAALEAENRRLGEQLRDAEEKLEAITTIERSIRDQE
jgi:chromosome segregation ATPase